MVELWIASLGRLERRRAYGLVPAESELYALSPYNTSVDYGAWRKNLLFVLLLFLSSCAPLSGEGSLGGASPPPAGSLSVSFIDVGQGDGILVQAGEESYLIDAGRAEEGPNVVDFLRSRGVKELDGIVVSNPDADHIGGFLDVLDAFGVGVVYVSGDEKGTLTYNTFLRGVREEGSKVEVVRAGRRLDWGGVRADVIAPPPGELFSETNDNSVAILLTYGTARILLAGDAEAREEDYRRAAPTRGLKRSSTFQNYTHSEPRFRALLTKGASELKLALI